MKRLTLKQSNGAYTCKTSSALPYIVAKLGRYEDAEENGLLLRLPCKIGDVIYVIPSETNYKLNVLYGYKENNRVYVQSVYSVQMWSNQRYSLKTCERLQSVVSDFYKKTWFLTREEAEQALQKLQEENT